MADSNLVTAVKALQAQLEGQTLSSHQTLQQFMTMVDSRMEDFRSQLPGSSGSPAGSSGQVTPAPPLFDACAGGPDISPFLHSVKMEVP